MPHIRCFSLLPGKCFVCLPWFYLFVSEWNLYYFHQSIFTYNKYSNTGKCQGILLSSMQMTKYLDLLLRLIAVRWITHQKRLILLSKLAFFWDTTQRICSKYLCINTIFILTARMTHSCQQTGSWTHAQNKATALSKTGWWDPDHWAYSLPPPSVLVPRMVDLDFQL